MSPRQSASLIGVVALAFMASSGIDWLFVRLLHGPQNAVNRLLLTASGRIPKAGVSAIPVDERFSAIPARVIGTPPDDLFERLIIDVGAAQGVRIGDAVVADSRVYVGRVADVRQHSAAFVYVGSELHQVTVRIANGTRPLAVLRGRGRLSAQAQYLPKEAALDRGASVETSEREITVPAGLSVGTVERVSIDSTGVFQEATVHLPIDYSTIEYVEVLHSKDVSYDETAPEHVP